MVKPRVATLDTRSAKPPPKEVDPFYLTPEHQAWRAEVIARAHGYCQDTQCKTPNRKPSRLFADHVIERRDDPSKHLDPNNGRAVCGSCHSRKTARERAKRMQANG